MNYQETIRKMVRSLNNPDMNGGFWLPNIQRHFVWTEEKIERLFDSIMRQYPIGTLLVWRTKAAIRKRKFVENYNDSLRISDLYVPTDTKPRFLVLDGQRRLQSLFIGLHGSYEGKELYFNVLSGEHAPPDDVKYLFKFLTSSEAGPPWFKVKRIVEYNGLAMDLTDHFASEFTAEPSRAELRKINRNVELVSKNFTQVEALAYQELDSIDNADLYKEDDVVEVFIRANSGGTALSKSDLLFSLLIAAWEDADPQMEDLLERLNNKGFVFTRDFVLKTCLSVLDLGAEYSVEKLRKDVNRQRIEENWEGISQAICDVLDFMVGKTFVRSHKALPSYLALIPLVYFRYRFPEKWTSAKNLPMYLLRSLLTGAFSGRPDELIDGLVRQIAADKEFNTPKMYEVIREQGRSLEVMRDRLLSYGYGSDYIHLLFNLWYDFDYNPSFENNLPQVDHIFPQSLLRQVKTPNPESGRPVMKYREGVRNQLANCMLLTREENGAGGKGHTPPDVWFAPQKDAYLEKHLIPKDPALWKVERFEDFLEARKSLIIKKFNWLLATPNLSNQPKGGEVAG